MNTKSSAVALLAAVFFAGIATTLATLRVVEHQERAERMEMRRPFPGPDGQRGERSQRFRRPPDGRGGPPPFAELAGMVISERLAEELGLTEEQRAQVDEIMERRRAVSEEVMREFLPRLRSQMDSLTLEIESILTEEQVEAFKESRGSERERYRRGGSRRFGPPGVQ